MRFRFAAALALAAFPALAQYTPPPRSTADILAVLDQYKPDAARINRLRDEVAKQPPPGGDAADLRKFYMARGEAAGQLGLFPQQLADLREALKYMPPSDPEHWFVYTQVGRAEMQAGDYAAALRMWRDAPAAAARRGPKPPPWHT